MAVSHVSAWQETGKMRFKRAASLEKRIERRKGQGSHDLETVPLTATRLISLSLWLLLATRTPAHTAETSRAEQQSNADGGLRQSECQLACSPAEGREGERGPFSYSATQEYGVDIDAPEIASRPERVGAKGRPMTRQRQAEDPLDPSMEARMRSREPNQGHQRRLALCPATSLRHRQSGMPLAGRSFRRWLEEPVGYHGLQYWRRRMLTVHLLSWGEDREREREGERKTRCWGTERGREGQETEGQASNRGWEVGASNTHGNNDGESDSRSRREDKRKRKIFLRGNKAARAIRGSGAYII
jgi:hypothetical protein